MAENSLLALVIMRINDPGSGKWVFRQKRRDTLKRMWHENNIDFLKIPQRFLK
jgi:hypothetical protein